MKKGLFRKKERWTNERKEIKKNYRFLKRNDFLEQNSKKKDCFFLNKRFEEMVEKLFFKLNEQIYLTNDFTERSFYEKKR